MRKIAALMVAFALVACVTDVARATEPFAKVGTYAMGWLGQPRGVRNVGMGGTGTADVSALATGYFNPAAMVFSDATRLAGSYEDWNVGDLNLSEGVVSSPIPFHSDSTASAWRFAGSFGYARLGMEPQVERTIFLPEGTGKTFDASDWGISALASSSWTHGVTTLAAGATGKYLDSKLANDDMTAWALDLGAIAAFSLGLGGCAVTPRLGYALRNLDTGVDYDGRHSDIANEQRIGMGVDLGMPVVSTWGRLVPVASLSMDFDYVDIENRSGEDMAAGFELSAIGLLHIRYGTTAYNSDTFGVGLGWDYGPVLLNVDWARTDDNGFLNSDRDAFGAMVGVRW